MVFDNLLNPVFNPLLSFPPLISILIISFLVTLIITIIYKLVTDQEVMRTLKADLKAFQAEMKKFKDNPTKVLEVQKKAMEKNMQYMTHSLKPTFFTLIPILIIFGWLSSHLAYHPIMPGEEFGVTAEFAKGSIGEAVISTPSGLIVLSEESQKVLLDEAAWVLKGESAGDYNVVITYNDRAFEKRVIISDEKEYANPIFEVKDKGTNLKRIVVNYEKVRPLNLFGWRVGWLGTYIIFSIIFSTVLRKILKLH
ncbi:DUF106 domain-containing protein [Candidatus Woesearchaeota archaeon]|nr:DUF106 domain-containing protein [Candidatus Woesearchaeota archaeon]